MESTKFSSYRIQNEVLTINSEHKSSDDQFERNSKPSFLYLIKKIKN